jgi:hypothetical protein
MAIKTETKPTLEGVSPDDARDLQLDREFQSLLSLATRGVKDPVVLSRSQLEEKAGSFRGKLEDELSDVLDLDNPVITSLREAELEYFSDRFEQTKEHLKATNAVDFMHGLFGGVYYGIDSSRIKSGEHQLVLDIGDGLVIKTKLVDQVLENQTHEGVTFIRLGAEPYQWGNLIAEDALRDIGINVPVAPTQYFNVKWCSYGQDSFPVVLPVEQPEPDFSEARKPIAEYPTFGVTPDLSRGGEVEVREVFDPRNRGLENYAELEKKLAESVTTILQYCKAYCEENGKVPIQGYEANISFHREPKGGYSLYESEVRGCFFILVEKNNPDKGTLVVGDLDGLSLRKK